MAPRLLIGRHLLQDECQLASQRRTSTTEVNRNAWEREEEEEEEGKVMGGTCSSGGGSSGMAVKVRDMGFQLGGVVWWSWASMKVWTHPEVGRMGG